MLIATLFTIAKLWKQPRCPTTDEQSKKMCYICTMENYSVIKKNGIMLFGDTWTEMGIIMGSEVNQAQRKKVTCFLSYVEARPKRLMHT
jgi:hypothetical protein